MSVGSPSLTAWLLQAILRRWTGSRRDLFRYLTAEEAADYLAIMDLFSATLLTDLSAAEARSRLQVSKLGGAGAYVQRRRP